MGEGYRRRHVRPLYPEIPASVCDCELLPKDYCCQRTDLVHAHEVVSEVCDAALEDGRRNVTYTRAHLCCPMCGQWWWLYSQDRTDFTYARDDEQRVVGSVSYAISHAVRVADVVEARALDEWLPRYFDALARRDRLFFQHKGQHANALVAAMQACIELAETTPATRMLSENSARARKLATNVRSACHEQMSRSMAILEAQPDDPESRKALATCQRLCADARLGDPARELGDWTIEEWWTPALAGVRRLEFEIHAVRNAARGRELGSHEHRALRVCEDEIARRWLLHVERVEWPHPDAAFMAMLEHARTLEPVVVARDMASWAHPDRICRQIKGLLDSGQVRPTRHIEAQQWIAVRTGLPDARERYLANAATSYWLPIRRARRAAGQPNSEV